MGVNCARHSASGFSILRLIRFPPAGPRAQASVQVPRRLFTMLVGHLGMHDFALRRGVERRAAVVTVFEREAVLEVLDLGDAAIAQNRLDLGGGFRRLVFRPEKRPYDAVYDLFLAALRQPHAILFQ